MPWRFCRAAVWPDGRGCVLSIRMYAMMTMWAVWLALALVELFIHGQTVWRMRAGRFCADRGSFLSAVIFCHSGLHAMRRVFSACARV